MKNFLISIFLLINVNLYSQDINIKYKKATQFIRDSINLCEKYNVRCSDNLQKNEKYKPIATFKVSPEINFISIQPLMYKISATEINVNLEAFDDTYKFEKYENRSLINLSSETGSQTLQQLQTTQEAEYYHKRFNTSKTRIVFRFNKKTYVSN